MKMIFICLILPWALFAGSVTMLNDSPFQLKATILSAQGDNLGSVTVMPTHQITWQDSYSGGQTFSDTPYSVIWYCMEGREYGIWTNVGSGALVTATGAQGPRICPVRKDPPPSPGIPQ